MTFEIYKRGRKRGRKPSRYPITKDKMAFLLSLSALQEQAEAERQRDSDIPAWGGATVREIVAIAEIKFHSAVRMTEGLKRHGLIDLVSQQHYSMTQKGDDVILAEATSVIDGYRVQGS